MVTLTPLLQKHQIEYHIVNGKEYYCTDGGLSQDSMQKEENIRNIIFKNEIQLYGATHVHGTLLE